MLSSVLRSDTAIEVNIRIIPNRSLEKASCHFLMAVNRKLVLFFSILVTVWAMRIMQRSWKQ